MPASVETASQQFRKLAKLASTHLDQPVARGAIEVLEATNRYMADEEWIITGNTTHTYNGTYRLVSTTNEAEPGDPLQPHRQTIRQYDGLNRVSEVQYLSWDWGEEEFQFDHRALYTYPGNGSQHESVVWQVFFGESWVNEYRETFTVTGDGSGFTAGQTYQWDGSEWIPHERYTLENVESGLLYTREEWDGASWQNDERIMVVGFTMENFVDLLNEIWRLEEDYEELLFVTSVLPDAVYEFWTGTDWQPYQRQSTTTFHDGTTGALIRAEKLLEVYDDGEWAPDGRIVLIYDLTDGELLDELQIQSYEDDEWEPGFWESYAYTETERFNAVEQFLRIEIEWEPGQIEVIVIPMALYTFEWAPAGVSTEQSASPGLLVLESIFPNPARYAAEVNYRLDHDADVVFEILDVLGRRVVQVVDGPQRNGAHSVRIDTSTMSSGVYFARLRTRDGSVTRTFTVVR